MRWLVPLAVLLTSPAHAQDSGDTGFDTAGLAGTTTAGTVADSGTTGGAGGTITSGGTTAPLGADSGEDEGWRGGFSAADLSGEAGGNSWDGACGDGSKSGLLLVGLLIAGRRRR